MFDGGGGHLPRHLLPWWQMSPFNKHCMFQCFNWYNYKFEGNFSANRCWPKMGRKIWVSKKNIKQRQNLAGHFRSKSWLYLFWDAADVSYHRLQNICHIPYIVINCRLFWFSIFLNVFLQLYSCLWGSQLWYCFLFWLICCVLSLSLYVLAEDVMKFSPLFGDITLILTVFIVVHFAALVGDVIEIL